MRLSSSLSASRSNRPSTVIVIALIDVSVTTRSSLGDGFSVISLFLTSTLQLCTRQTTTLD